MNTIKNYISNNLWDIVLYIAVAMTVLGQVIIGWQYYIGQGSFLIANVIYVVRDIKLERPKSDIIKDVIFSGLTISLMVIYSLQ